MPMVLTECCWCTADVLSFYSPRCQIQKPRNYHAVETVVEVTPFLPSPILHPAWALEVLKIGYTWLPQLDRVLEHHAFPRKAAPADP